jgi:UDP-GlcNAc:undecaprenyl-phosphate/decaprenyl-phosphate GlcNAc-1-phosphate transferase
MRAGLTALCAFVVALAGTPAAMALARRLNLVDRPGRLKPQKIPVPYLGGTAVFAGTVIGAAVGRPLTVIPLVMAVGLGILDDAKGLSPWVRLGGEIAIGAVVAAIVPVHLPPVLGPALVVLATVVLANGMNFLDGIDALAAGVGLVAAGGFALLLHGDGRYLAVALTCALVGFLPYNKPPARIYLGDSGAYLIGTTLSILLALAWGTGSGATVSRASLLLVMIPPAEILFAVVRRLRARQSVLVGDRSHPYDRLVRRGWPALAASLLYVAAEAVLAVVAIIVSKVHALVPATATVGGVAVFSVCLAGSVGAFKSDARNGASPVPDGRCPQR